MVHLATWVGACHMRAVDFASYHLYACMAGSAQSLPQRVSLHIIVQQGGAVRYWDTISSPQAMHLLSPGNGLFLGREITLQWDGNSTESPEQGGQMLSFIWITTITLQMER
jgi:hypothetical protein